MVSISTEVELARRNIRFGFPEDVTTEALDVYQKHLSRAGDPSVPVSRVEAMMVMKLCRDVERVHPFTRVGILARVSEQTVQRARQRAAALLCS